MTIRSGKSLRISDSTSVMVTGVMEDINRSVIPNADLLVRIERVTEFNQSLSKTNPVTPARASRSCC